MKYFGTDGIRRKADFFTEEFLKRVCAAVAAIKSDAKVVIARDPRPSGVIIEKILSEGLAAAGIKVITVGMTATPVLAFCVRKYNADLGVMVSASHNPPEYNGIKFFDSEGRKITEELEEKIEEIIDGGYKPRRKKGGSVTPADGEGDYVRHFSALLKPRISPKRVLLDTANGATSFVAPRLFEALGCVADVIFNDVGGEKINDGCGATAPEAFIEAAKKGKYDAGFCFDGDGDRVVAYCGGRVLDGDHMVYITAKYFLERGELSEKTIVGTIMSNRGVEDAVLRSGLKFVRTSVGDKYVAYEMKRLQAELGGEASGHVIIARYQNTGDGVLAGAVLLACDSAKGVNAYDDITDYPQTSGDILTTQEKVAEYKARQKEFAPMLEIIQRESGGRLVVRPSGTEPKIRIMAEAPTQAAAYLAVAKARLCILGGLGNV